MDYNVAEYRQALTDARAFGMPLARDLNFKLLSPETYDYNCIAFAMGKEDRWIDCEALPWHWWPSTVARDRSEQGLIAAFEYLGFQKCGMDDAREPGFEKVALYSSEGKWTHAARVVGNGIYHSKFGASFDGLHSRGNVLALRYGQVYQVMRRVLALAESDHEKFGMPPGVIHLQKKVHVDGYEDHLVLHDGKIFLANYGREVVLRPDGSVALA